MTDDCQDWIHRAVAGFQMKGEVLEVGSFDVNGNPRHHFADRNRFPKYVGIDMRPGPAVDCVMNVQQLAFKDASFDVVVDAERMEHDDRFWKSCQEEYRILRPGGFLIITTRSWNGFGPHDYPSDYWRFMSDGLRVLLESCGFRCLETAYGEDSRAVFAVGQKPIITVTLSCRR